MELSGDEKRIQALFSELSLEDQSRTPRFERLWVPAEETLRAPALVVRRSVVVITAVVVLAAGCLVAAFSWYRSSVSQHAVSIPPQTIPTTSVPRAKQAQTLLSADSKAFGTTRRPRIPVRQRKAERVATHEVATLSSWQSPTGIFLQSPAAAALSSLPQLNQSARELQAFLPKNNEVIKESKQ